MTQPSPLLSTSCWASATRQGTTMPKMITQMMQGGGWGPVGPAAATGAKTARARRPATASGRARMGTAPAIQAPGLILGRARLGQVGLGLDGAHEAVQAVLHAVDHGAAVALAVDVLLRLGVGARQHDVEHHHAGDLAEG